MFGRKKKQVKEKRYYWVNCLPFERGLTKLLQSEVDNSPYDLRVRYEQSISIPELFWKIVIPFSDGQQRTTSKEFEATVPKILKELRESEALKVAAKKMVKLASKEGLKVLSVSYVLCNDCGDGVPGVLVYWKR